MRMNIDVSLERRRTLPTWLDIGSQISTVFAALFVGAIALIILDVNPIDAYVVMFIDTVVSPRSLTNTLIRSVPLVLSGFAFYLPLKAGLENIGAEGQIYLGGILGVVVGLNLNQSSLVLVPLILFAGLVGGALWGLIPALMRAKWDVNEILTTLMSVFIAIQLNEYLIGGPMQAGFGYPRSKTLPDAAQLPTIPGTNLHIGVLFLVITPIFVYLLLNKTTLGYEMLMTGSNPDAAEDAGISRFKAYFVALVLGSAFAGLGGIIEVAGNQTLLTSTWNPGYGWTGIPIALLGRRGAFQMTVVGIFFAIMAVGSLRMQSAMGVPPSIADVLEALIILFLITAEFIRSFKVNIKMGDQVDAVPDISPASVEDD